jgi:hypothetical protein
LRDVSVTGIGTDSVVQLPDFRVERPAFRYVYDVEAGRLQRRDADAPQAPR